MNVTVTGSLGNISKPLTQELVQKRHSRSKAERQKDIEVIGVKDFAKEFAVVFSQR